MSCHFCDRINAADANFCGECGNALHLKPCAKCGALNARAATSCHRCGHALPTVAVFDLEVPARAIDAWPAPSPAPTRRLADEYERACTVLLEREGAAQGKLAPAPPTALIETIARVQSRRRAATGRMFAFVVLATGALFGSHLYLSGQAASPTPASPQARQGRIAASPAVTPTASAPLPAASRLAASAPDGPATPSVDAGPGVVPTAAATEAAAATATAAVLDAAAVLARQAQASDDAASSPEPMKQVSRAALDNGCSRAIAALSLCRYADESVLR